ncbi:hypothetical protein PTTG_25656 [Puccinia triticina 1-1 BBBD Race 1]|uniref:Nudix hydrolase domain-containing protein n=2 Tax=Puccinia triticina TaxID=208348 RepID=A0A180H1G3_PUCT1|nr:uncharacterized protein PtA15_9A446 [Puccinia triticina]OAV98418.1 hypothetical protein PTTG_25656 [Puccinia triticina 1-1 BBBD Race 1]WAQ88319.1 hypothetical protein PtA15_9A446 [Puccinia triticina]WAR60497.1 hypothetical protein PtB15_9B436 [Puccinia triticina]
MSLATSQTSDPPKPIQSPYLRENASPETWQALEQLSQLPEPQINLESLPAGGVAAVLVLLHLAPGTGDLAVTLTTRSQRLRSHPGDTALPGGRVDPSDENVISAALREANEEIGLPIKDLSDYGYLGTMDPFLSRNLLVVYPVLYIYLQSPESLLRNLKANEDEVSEIFHLPLQSIVQASSQQDSISTTPDNLNLLYSSRDLKWIHGTPYRWHSFSSPRLPSPLTGMTADILLSVVTLAYRIPNPSFGSVKAPGQEEWKTLVDWALAGEGGGQGDQHSIIRKPRATV